MTIVVHKSAQSLSVSQFEDHAILHEGVVYAGTIKVSTSYFPVTISAVNLPSGVSISSTSDPTVYYVNYTPPFTAVTQSEHQNTCLEADGVTSQWCNTISWTLTVIDSQGLAKNISALWTIMDVRQKPVIQLVTTPTFLDSASQSLPDQNQPAPSFAAKFSIEVDDPNGETVPQVTMQTTPIGGSFAVDIAVANASGTLSLPFSLVNVTWSDIPGTLRGSSQSLDVNACVLGGPNQDTTCTTLPMAINL